MWFVKYKFSCKQHDGVYRSNLPHLCWMLYIENPRIHHHLAWLWPHHLRYLCRLQTLQTQLWSIKKTFVLLITKEREDQWIVVWACKKQMNRFFFCMYEKFCIQVFKSMNYFLYVSQQKILFFVFKKEWKIKSSTSQ